tara:strand:- start:314 stop:541 length:228 start_codon:yes stop_codon:yes gene_type:complete
MTRSIRSFNDLRFSSLLNADSTSRKANVLEALIIQASNEYIKVMKDIGNDDSEAERRDLAYSIQHPDLWEKNQLS